VLVGVLRAAGTDPADLAPAVLARLAHLAEQSAAARCR